MFYKKRNKVFLLSLKEKFNQEFQPVLEDMRLPPRLADTYRPESCLVHREGCEIWLLRGTDGGQFVLKLDRTGKSDLAGEFRLMQRLPRELEGSVPMPVDCFEEDGVRYLLRTYLPGRPLSESRGPADAARCVEVGVKLCTLLEQLHSLDEPVIHRDIKPENIILTPQGEVGLIDFGIARVYKEGQDADTMFMGTRSTAPPEQYGYAQTDRRADIYSLGVTLRWMLTGSYQPEALEQADCPERLKQCLNKAAAFSPKDRYASAGELGRALSGALKRHWKKPLLAAVCLAAVLAVLVGTALLRPWDGRAVAFDNALLEQAVRAELDKPEGAVTYKDLKQVERLAVVGQNLLGEEQEYTYTIFGYVDGVPQFEQPSGDISDLSLLAKMPNLRVLYLCQQQISDLSPLKGLPLEELYLPDNDIRDLSPLGGMLTLRRLFLGNNPFTDLTPLASLPQLQKLDLDYYGEGWVESFAPLAGLHLQELSLGTRFPADGDWSFLEELDTVWELWLWRAPAEVFPHLAGMEGLTSLNIGEFGGASLSELWAPALDYLGLFNGVDTLEGLEELENLYLVNLEGLDGISLEPLARMEKLRHAVFTNCREMDYTPLLRVPTLEMVEVWDEVSRQELLRDCPQPQFQLGGIA